MHPMPRIGMRVVWRAACRCAGLPMQTCRKSDLFSYAEYPSPEAKPLAAPDIVNLVRGFHPSAVVIAAVDLELFTTLGAEALSSAELAPRMGCQGARGVTILCDALVGLGLLTKSGERYSAPESVRAALGQRGPGSVLALTQHMSNIYRGWGQLAEIVKGGGRGSFEVRFNSIRGKEKDEEAFIEAMNDLSEPEAGKVLPSVRGLKGNHFLD
eukprot:RCo007144